MAGRKRNCSRTERSLSELPGDVIHHIFSYVNLTCQQAIQLSLLSKQLHRVLQKRPTLVFDSHFIHRGSSWPVYIKRYREELNYILSTLARYHRDNIQLETFTLIAAVSMYAPVLTMLRIEEDIYKRCIELAAKKGLRNLNLELKTDFVLPEPVFEVESLEELNLYHCCLRPNGTVAWPNLKRLSISVGTRVADEKAFKNIISGCPSIEYLKVNSRSFADFNVIKLSNLPNLMQLDFVLRLNQRLEMNATPNLESIRCRSSEDIPYHDSYFLGFGNTEYPSLGSLDVTCGELKEHFFVNFERRFPMLEKLFFDRTLRRIDLSSTSLKEIKLIDNMSLQEACFDVPNLVRFECENYNNIPKLTFVDNCSRWSSCIKLKVYPGIIDASWFLKLNEFLAALNMFETSITVQFQGTGVFSDKAYSFTADPVISVPEIREFSMETNRSEISSSFVSAVLDGVFSICQPQTLKFMDCPKHLHEKLVSRSGRDYREVTDFEMSRMTGEDRSGDKFPEMLEKKKTIRIFQLEYCSQKCGR